MTNMFSMLPKLTGMLNQTSSGNESSAMNYVDTLKNLQDILK